jgi:hypothetical protein
MRRPAKTENRETDIVEPEAAGRAPGIQIRGGENRHGSYGNINVKMDRQLTSSTR